MFKVFRALVTFIFTIFYRVKVSGAKYCPKEGAVIIASNHETMLDMFMIGYRLPRKVHWMAKEELFHKNKLLTKFITWLGAYPVKREAAGTSAVRTTLELLKKGETIGIFPQGTRRKGRDLRELKPKAGVIRIALEAGVPVLPAAIWGGIHLFGKIKVRFGEPYRIPPKEDGTAYSKEECNVLVNELMEKIFAMMEEPDANSAG